ncbi:dopamine receptor 2-like [Chironomus tepperi]|uniref:dopamine receptor 2-like n=1 Tax=Chironomus tepperi TaxID=113505 RepID=UPI00391F6E7E
MPFSALYEVLQNTWFFGENWCDIWRSLDVLFSTASILNLCVISLDRYWAITDPFSYPMKMTRNRAAGLIAAVWICSSLISFPAIYWWRAARNGPMPALKCNFTEHLGYLVFSSTISFYLPLLVMVFTYCRIYRAAVVQTRSLKLGTKQVLMASGETQLTLRIHRGGTTRERDSSHHHQLQHQHQNTTANSTPEEPDEEPLSALHNNGIRRDRQIVKNFSLSRKLAKFAKEKKAAKTLGIVMGVFIICWLPFFVVNLLTGLCVDCIAHEEIVSAVVTWLGWINSSMNPVIYACWSRDFRRAFVRILCVCCPRKIRRKYQPTMRSKASQQCHLASVVTSTASSCSVCDGTQMRTTRLRSCSKMRHNLHHNCCHNHHHHYHRRNRVIKQIKRCTFATTTTEIPNTNELITEENQHMSFKSQSSNSSNASSIRIIE